MKSIRRQFFIYLVALLAVSGGFILSQYGLIAIVLIFAPIALLLLMGWDENRYKRAEKKTSVRQR